MVLSHLGLEFVLMLRPFFPELVMSTDLLSFEHPSVLLFCLELNHFILKDTTLTLFCPFRYNNISSKMLRNNFPKWPSDAELCTIYIISLLVLHPSTSFAAMPCFVYGRQRLAVTWQQCICTDPCELFIFGQQSNVMDDKIDNYYHIIYLRFCHRYVGRYGFEKNISSCTVSYTALPMKTDLHFQPTLP